MMNKANKIEEKNMAVAKARGHQVEKSNSTFRSFSNAKPGKEGSTFIPKGVESGNANSQASLNNRTGGIAVQPRGKPPFQKMTEAEMQEKLR